MGISILNISRVRAPKDASHNYLPKILSLWIALLCAVALGLDAKSACAAAHWEVISFNGGTDRSPRYDGGNNTYNFDQSDYGHTEQGGIRSLTYGSVRARIRWVGEGRAVPATVKFTQLSEARAEVWESPSTCYVSNSLGVGAAVTTVNDHFRQAI
jgi:hypothetical protein